MVGASLPYVIQVRAAENNTLVLLAPSDAALDLVRLAGKVRNLFDLDADPLAIHNQLNQDRLLRPIVKRAAGTRVPGCWDGFELGVRAILGQQVSVAGATTLAGRFVARYGESVSIKDEEWRLFPTPERLLRARIESIGLPKQRAQAIRELAGAYVHKKLLLDSSSDVIESCAHLKALSGVGEWTAQYVAMRALRDPDAFPSGDLALRRAFEQLGSRKCNEKELLEHATGWRPWRAYAVMHLWRYLTMPYDA